MSNSKENVILSEGLNPEDIDFESMLPKYDQSETLETINKIQNKIDEVLFKKENHDNITGNIFFLSKRRMKNNIIDVIEIESLYKLSHNHVDKHESKLSIECQIQNEIEVIDTIDEINYNKGTIEIEIDLKKQNRVTTLYPGFLNKIISYEVCDSQLKITFLIARL